MEAKRILDNWLQLDRKTKLMALGTVLLMGVAIYLSFNNFTLASEGTTEISATAEEGVVITSDMEPIPTVDEKMQQVASLVDVLSNEECIWHSPDNELCSIQFTKSGYNEYLGDIKTSCTYEFYEIEATGNTLSGIWRVTYPDESTHDAQFAFTQDYERGVYTIASSAFKEAPTYEAKFFTSSNVLDW